MSEFLRKLRLFLLVILFLFTILTSYFILNKYLFNSRIKGMSPEDIENSIGYLILPLSIFTAIIWFVEKQIKKTKNH